MRYLIIALCVLTLGSTSSYAAQQKEDKPVPSLQLKFFPAPVQTKQGAFTTTLRMVTPLLAVVDPSYSPQVCKRFPKIIEGLLNYFMKNPVPVDKKRRLDVVALEAQRDAMTLAVNRAIGYRLVSAVYIVEGQKAIATGVTALFPGARANACGPIIKMHEKKLKETQKAKN